MVDTPNVKGKGDGATDKGSPRGPAGAGARLPLRWVLRFSESYFRRRAAEIRKPPLCRDVAPGEAWVVPPEVAAGGSPVTVTLVFRCGEGGIRRGGGIRVCPARLVDFGGGARRAVPLLMSGWGAWQTRYPRLPNYVSVCLSSSSHARVRLNRLGLFPLKALLRYLWWTVAGKLGADLPPFDLLYHLLEERKVRVKVVEGELREGDEIRLVIGDHSRGGRGWKVPFRASSLDLAVEVDEAGDGRYRLVRECPRLRATGGEVEGLEAVLQAREPGRARLWVRAVDGKGDTAEDFTGSLRVWDGAGRLITEFRINEAERGVKGVELELPGEDGIRLRVEAGPHAARSNPLPARWMGRRLFWGDLHVHSALCDGTLDPTEFYRWAREEGALDFAAITTHDNVARFEPSGREEEWELMRRLAEEFTEPGAFVVLLGYEWSRHSRGHRGVFYAPGEPDPRVFSSTEDEAQEVEDLEEALGERMALLVPHHTAWRKVFFIPWNWAKFIRLRIPERYTWGENDGRMQRLVEIYSDHGSSEYPDPSLPITHGNPGPPFPPFMRYDGCREGVGNYVREALAAGYRLGIIAGSDRHDYPLDPARYSVPVHPRGLTGLWAEELTPEAVWAALWNRTVYGTTGARMVVQLEADGLPMGSEYVALRPPCLRGRVMGHGRIRAELWRHGAEGYSLAWSGAGSDEVSFELEDGKAGGSVFYYLRAEQEDGHKAWSSPIWVDFA